MHISREKLKEIVEEEVKRFAELTDADVAPPEAHAAAPTKQAGDVEKATGRMQDVSSLQAYIQKIDTPQEMEQFLGNVVKMASQKMSKAQVLTSLTRLLAALRKEN